MKNILLVGITGSGKSTLANVLLNKNDNFDKVFKIGESTSKTKEVQIEEFMENGTKYRIIDTPGIMATGLTPQQVADKIVEAFQVAKEGINQILFVYEGQFSERNVEFYNSLKLVDKNINQYITMVRTNFTGFENEEKCRKEDEIIKDAGRVRPEIASIFQEVVTTIRVNNPPLSYDPQQKERKKSREILINHLASRQGNFQSTNLQADYFLSTEEKLKKQIEKEKKGGKSDRENEASNNPKKNNSDNNERMAGILFIMAVILVGFGYWLARRFLF
jgi:GTPase Era involved in 16S rRNA processing